jgi:hypothetical protein
MVNRMSKDTIYRQDVINGVKTLHDVAWKNWHEPTLSPNVVLDMIRELPSAQPEPISEEYAKAVRTWLINYQVRCAELAGRYTPYEILGWIVSDWRKENEIW